MASRCDSIVTLKLQWRLQQSLDFNTLHIVTRLPSSPKCLHIKLLTTKVVLLYLGRQMPMQKLFLSKIGYVIVLVTWQERISKTIMYVCMYVTLLAQNHESRNSQNRAPLESPEIPQREAKRNESHCRKVESWKIESESPSQSHPISA